ncbi:LysR substrate-binding domain-containing protein [Nonomuraea sp. NPDC046802]|uniref:LysR substrate-binding domain-containing protein n=1 Tax=Nonomuraea sp. NPDC046802 TaxID=3154919 RepID=UPI0033E223B9
MADLRRMEYFVAVAEELHFGRAAARLHISQPPLSMQIQRLEQEVGVELLRRTKRSVQLTAAGKVFLEEARATLRQAGRAAELARRAAKGDIGRLAIGVIDAALYGLVPPLVRRFTERHPDVDVTVTERRIHEQIDLVARGELDVGFVHPPVEHPDLAVEAVRHEPFVLAVPEDHPLAAAEDVTLAQACAQPLIQPPRELNPIGHDSLLALCHQHGAHPTIAREASPKQTIIALVAAGLGASVLPEAVRNSGYPGVVYRPIEGGRFGITTSLIWSRRHLEPSARLFVDLVCQPV